MGMTVPRQPVSERPPPPPPQNRDIGGGRTFVDDVETTCFTDNVPRNVKKVTGQKRVLTNRGAVDR